MRSTIGAASFMQAPAPRSSSATIALRSRAFRPTYSCPDGCDSPMRHRYGQLADRERVHVAGFEAHIVKPVDLVALQAALG